MGERKLYKWIYVCAWCKKVIGEQWHDTPQKEASHGICPECERKYIQPHIDELERKRGKR